MKRLFIFLFLTLVTTFGSSCKTNSTADNLNQVNVNSSTVTIQTNQENTNVAVQSTPLPTFTDAPTALAEGKKLLDQNETTKSIEALQQAIKLDPNSAEAHFNLGIAYAALEKENENTPAPVVEETTVTSKKGKKEVIKLTASEKSFENAAKLYETVTKNNPKDDVAFFNLGRSYNKLNKDEEAEKALRQAVKLNPEDPEYQTELGSILIKLSHYDDAIGALKKALAIDENNSRAQDLMDKADAGKKRIDFAVKNRNQPTSTGSTVRSTAPRGRPTPPQVIENAPAPKINPTKKP